MGFTYVEGIVLWTGGWKLPAQPAAVVVIGGVGRDSHEDR
jgi:hypothetical protein